ncbi:hypothetical protein MAHJHV65_45880 [Mycobacterium avium subsp. hominissuis]|uniref:hypothetical protein n=1 Tax=Mycobacterium avium TaxID=1764 RepID=UPI0012DAE7F7|nr:hypothetical protein [Mycobacterium avium]
MSKRDKDFDWSAGDIFSRVTREEVIAMNDELVDKMVTDAAKVDRVFTKHHRPR